MNLDDVATRKRLYRHVRLLMWSFILALAFLVAFKMVEVAPEYQKFTFILFMVAFWVIAYHALEWLKARLVAIAKGVVK